MFDRDTLNSLRADGELLTRVVGQHLSLTKAGPSELKGKCPFHQEKTASFYVVEDKGFCHCFGCGWGGDVFDFVQELNGLDFVGAVHEVADEAGLVLERSSEWAEKRQWKSSLLAACKEAHAYYRFHLSDPQAQAYLGARGLAEHAEKWELGFAPDAWGGLSAFLQSRRVEARAGVRAGVLGESGQTGRVWDFFRGRLMFPIKDHRGRVVGFAGRAITEGQQPKYINTPETELYHKGELLFGLAAARPNIQASGKVVLVEGYTDVIACHAAGVGEAVATCGTALTEQHVTKISRLVNRVVEAKDPDRAGMAAMEKDLVPLLKAGLQVDRVQLPGLDPDELYQERGAEALKTLVDEASPLLREVLHGIAKRHPWTPQGRRHAALEAVPLLRGLKGIAKQEAVAEAASILSVNERILRNMVGSGPAYAQLDDVVDRPQLQGPIAEVIWALANHYAKAAPVLHACLRPEWLNPDMKTIIHSMMREIPVSIICVDLPGWRALQLRALVAHRMRHGAGQVRRLVAESCARIELGYVQAMLGAATGQHKLGLQRRRLELLDELALGVLPA